MSDRESRDPPDRDPPHRDRSGRHDRADRSNRRDRRGRRGERDRRGRRDRAGRDRPRSGGRPPPGWIGWSAGDTAELARLAARVAWRYTEHSLRARVRTAGRVARAAARAESPGELVAETEAILAEEVERFGTALARERRADGRSPDGERAGERPADGSLADGLLGDGLLANGGPTAGEHTRGRSGGRGRRAGRETDRWGVPTDGGPTARSLRDRGARLLAESAETDRGDRGEPVHPAYARIVEEIAADEARILRLLATEGPQPSVDVRDGGLVPLTTDLIAAGLSMIGNRAGCRREERTSAYLNNLQRLGLVWFSEEPVAELKRYQVVEAQPDVLEARERARRPKIDRRSVHLTPFGVDFCRVCLPVEVIADGAMGAYELPDDGESPGDGDGPSRDG